MQCACAILSSVACPALQYFFLTLSHKQQDFRKMSLNIKYEFLFSLHLLSETLLILRRTERDMIINAYWFICEVTVTVVRF